MISTIAAISTAPAAAGLGVIRLSARRPSPWPTGSFPPQTPKKLKDLPGYTARYGHVYDEEGPIDECVALVFRAPHSYTGEDVVELSCHGACICCRGCCGR